MDFEKQIGEAMSVIGKAKEKLAAGISGLPQQDAEKIREGISLINKALQDRNPKAIEKVKSMFK